MYTRNKRNHSTSASKYFNMTQFLDIYHNHPENCRNTLIKLRFPNGWVCPDCGCTKYRWLNTRNCMQCNHFYHQTHILAGTVLQNCRLSYFEILLGIFLFVSSQSGINGSTLAVQMGINVNTARLFLRKLRLVCQTGNEDVLLSGAVQLDGAYFGGVNEGGKQGLGSDKQTVMVCVEVQEVLDKNEKPLFYPGKARFCLVKSEKEIVPFVQRTVKKGTTIYSDKGRGICVLNQKNQGCRRKYSIRSTRQTLQTIPIRFKERAFR